jgi:hypothetical protein
MPIVTVNPDNEKSSIIAAGQYGVASPALLMKLVYGPGKFNAAQTVASFTISVNDASAGRITRTIDVVDWASGSKVPKFLRQLGVTDEQQKAGFDTDTLTEVPVVVDIGIREYTKNDGTPGRGNTIVNIMRLGD